MTLSPSLVFVPVDGDEASLAAVEYAAAIAAEYDATVHALYVVGTELARAFDDGTVDDGDLAAEVASYLETVGDVVAEVGAPLSTSMAAGFSTRRLSRHPGSVVLDTADAVGADFLVVPRESEGREVFGTGTRTESGGDGDTSPSDTLSKAAEHVLCHATQPVLSV
jgi:nucleotide-binding universal stress UspA family protein